MTIDKITARDETLTFYINIKLALGTFNEFSTGSPFKAELTVTSLSIIKLLVKAIYEFIVLSSFQVSFSLLELLFIYMRYSMRMRKTLRQNKSLEISDKKN